MNDLVELASRGDREAFAALATASIDRLFAIARRRRADRSDGRVARPFEDGVVTAVGTRMNHFALGREQ